MLRVLKPNGIILWYDYFISKPTNPDVKGVGKREIKRLLCVQIIDEIGDRKLLMEVF